MKVTQKSPHPALNSALPCSLSGIGLKTAWLTHFVVTCRAERWALSAEILGISPQALRRSLEAFSAHLGGGFFSLKGPEIQLSERGKALYAELNPIFETLDGLKEQVRAAQRYAQGYAQPSPFVLGLCRGYWPDPHFFKQLLLSLAPQQGLQCQYFESPTELALALQEQRIDLALSHQALNGPGALTLLGPSSPFVIVSAASAPPETRRPWWQWKYALAPAPQRPAWQDHLPKAQIHFETNSTALLIKAAQAGDCAVCLPAFYLHAPHAWGSSLAVVATPPCLDFFTAWVSVSEHPHSKPHSPHKPNKQKLLQKLAEFGYVVAP